MQKGSDALEKTIFSRDQEQTRLPFEKIERQVLVRRECETDPAYGKRPEERTVEELIESGMLLINKPKGPTSHQVTEWAKNIVGIHRAGQAGTLDPSVTGLLPIALGRARKTLQVLLTAGKEYVCYMHLHSDMPHEQIRKVLEEKFVGRIRQLPPLKSAVKRQWRYRKIYYIDILDMDGREILFKVGCQAGTYIRKLCHDMGEALGCGAHMAQLIRTKSGGFRWEEMVTLHDLKDAYHEYQNERNPVKLKNMLYPVEEIARHLPKVWVCDDAVNPLANGLKLYAEMVAKAETEIQKDELIAVMTLKDELIMFAESAMTSRDLVEQQGYAAKTVRVSMQTDVYPKL
ncbi:MAG: RNA-guided pseudouridylation complex pseudouridine synthase subunit Cbf5 [Nanoarchaeota archaeon]